MQQRMQREMLTNSDAFRQIFDNPLVQQLMSDPENMRSLLLSNPQMQELMQSNPEISHMLNNPDLLRYYFHIFLYKKIWQLNVTLYLSIEFWHYRLLCSLL